MADTLPRQERALTVDPQAFRAIIGNFATGVTVITAASGDEMQGMTANAFTSLSLDPVMVLICVDRSSHTHRVLQQGGAFAVNILGAHQREVSQLFAKKAAPERGTLRGQEFRIGETGAPVLKDCLAYFECRIAEELPGGDHTIFLGEVVDAAVVGEGRPLVFYRAEYRELA
jgi:flavin reductase (DIM6/NTAB) family NADH-FMN oxidoreductase RutF